MNSKKIGRIITSPICLIVNQAMVIFSCIFVIGTLITVYGFIALITRPIRYFIENDTKDGIFDDVMIDYSRYQIINEFLAMTVVIWYPYWQTYRWIEHSEFTLPD